MIRLDTRDVDAEGLGALCAQATQPQPPESLSRSSGPDLEELVAFVETYEVLVKKFDPWLRHTGPDEADRLLADRHVIPYIGKVQQLRAAYEYSREIVWAHQVLASPDPLRSLETLMAPHAHWALSVELIRALKTATHGLFAGSGPLPMTALSIAIKFSIPVTAVDRDLAAVELGEKITALHPQGHLITHRVADLATLPDIETYETVIVAQLVGIDPCCRSPHRKTEAIERAASRMRAGSRLIFRDSVRLGRLIYAPVNDDVLSNWTIERSPSPSEAGAPYRSGIAIATRR